MVELIQSLGTLAVLAAFIGCGGASPTSTSTLQGTIKLADGSAATGVRAAIAGSNLSATTDSAGQFSLSGAPQGPATLQLTASGVSAKLSLPKLGSNMVVRVSVRLSDDGKAEMESEPEAELSGTIDSIAAPDLRVAGHAIHTDAQTDVRIGGARATLADLKQGETVEVEGAQQADGSVLARKIKADVEHAPESEVDLRGAIDSIAAPDLVLGGKTVHTDANTRIEIGSQAAKLSDLKQGQQIEVEGALQADGSVLAKEIKAGDAQQPPPSAPPPSEVELRGSVDSMSGTDLTVAGHLVHTGTLTVVDGNGAKSLADVKPGALVEVRGTLQADGSTLAERVHLED